MNENNTTFDEEDFEDKPRMATIESEALLERIYPFETMSPEEWVARNGPSWFGGFVFADYLYRNSKLEDWFLKIHSLISTRESIEALQQDILSNEEREEVRQQQNRLVKNSRDMGDDIGYFMDKES